MDSSALLWRSAQIAGKATPTVPQKVADRQPAEWDCLWPRGNQGAGMVGDCG